MSLRKLASEINQEMADKAATAAAERGEVGPSRWITGRVYINQDRPVLLITGYYLDPIYKRLSNHWAWRSIQEDGTLGPVESSYGGCEPDDSGRVDSRFYPYQGDYQTVWDSGKTGYVGVILNQESFINREDS